MKHSINKILAWAICLLIISSCSKDILNEHSQSVLVADNLYQNEAGFKAGLNGLYDEVRRVQSGDTYGSANDLMLEIAVIGVDNAYGNYAAGPESIANNWVSNNNPSVGYYSLYWAWLYETINAANTIIDRAKNPKISWAANDKNEILAEAKCIRAWCYRHLTYLWGDVPLTLHESSGSNIKTDWQRTPVAEVRDSMEADWLFAEQYLPETSNNDGQVIRGVPETYLAELYLAENKPQQAKTEALKVTQDPNYALITQRYGADKNQPGTPYTDMFIDGNSDRSEGNTEGLWVIQNEINVIGGEGNNIMSRYWINRYYSINVGGKNPIAISGDNGGGGIGRLGPTKFALDLYGPGDDRGSSYAWRWYWIMNNPNSIPKGHHLGDTLRLDTTKIEKLSNPSWPNTRKWDYADPLVANNSRDYKDQVYLRSADDWLLLAEANYDLNDLQGAADAINTLRARAHAALITAGQITLNFILDERSRELFSEEERRYTLLRTHTWLQRTRLDNYMAGPNIAARDTLLPIPQDVIDANIGSPMKQNPGY